MGDNLRILKALVIGMGIAILVGAVVLVTAIVQRAGNLAISDIPNRVVIPEGAVVVETRLDGRRILLRLALAEGGTRLMVLDSRSGRVQSQLVLEALAAP